MKKCRGPPALHAAHRAEPVGRARAALAGLGAPLGHGGGGRHAALHVCAPARGFELFVLHGVVGAAVAVAVAAGTAPALPAVVADTATVRMGPLRVAAGGTARRPAAPALRGRTSVPAVGAAVHGVGWVLLLHFAVVSFRRGGVGCLRCGLALGRHVLRLLLMRVEMESSEALVHSARDGHYLAHNVQGPAIVTVVPAVIKIDASLLGKSVLKPKTQVLATG